MNALGNEQVGKFINEHFASSFQKVATFRVVGGQKQGGNVAAYFCAPDGRVLHVVAGPVDSATFLREARWVVDTAKKGIELSKGDGAAFKTFFRKAHAEKLRAETGLVVEATTFDPPSPDEGDSALSFRDPTGRPLAPKLPPPPIDGPDVRLEEKQFKAQQAAEAGAPGARLMVDRRGNRLVLGNQGRVDTLLAGHVMAPIEKIYGTIFENILGEKISKKPVEVVTPFPWVKNSKTNGN